MTIFIYSEEGLAASSFWDFFFRSCGMWVEKKDLQEDQYVMHPADSGIILTIHKVDQQQEYSYAIYAVSDEDVSDRSKNYEKEVISCLFGGFPEYGEIEKLLDIYMVTDLWKAGWIYEEFANDNSGQWNQLILDICDKVLKLIDEEFPQDHSSEYAAYMKFYCRYIRCGIMNHSPVLLLVESGELLNEYMPLADKYAGNGMFPYLAGKICELSFIENKQAVYFYQKVKKQIRQFGLSRYDIRHSYSELLYDIGHSYEKVYGDEEYAIEFYKKAYLMDKNNFRAVYKLAAGKEVEGKWLDAFNFYGVIENRLHEIVETACANGKLISIRELEYLYKVYKRRYYICRQMLGFGDFADDYEEKIEDIIKRLITGKSFEHLTACMSKSPDMGKEIVEELKKRFQGRCYQ